jgi:hypothetical protein
MKNKMMIKLMTVSMLALVAMSGCYFSSAQMIELLGQGTAASPGLAAVTINAAYTDYLNGLLNPAANATRQTFVDYSKRLATTITNSWISSEIPLDPGSIK